jgi:hypothetical protein
MARTTPRPAPTDTQLLQPLQRYCPTCGETMWAAYHTYRTITTLEAVLALTLHIRRCLNRSCPHFRQPYRPEQEGRLALPKHEFGLDVIAIIGQWRDADHRSIPAISQAVRERPVALAPRTVTPLLERYDALVALSLHDTTRLQRLTQARGRVIFALDALQPDVGHAVLWGLRDGLAGEVLLARRFLSATHEDLAHLVQEGQQALQVPLVGGSSDGQPSSRAAVAQALPGVPHQWCHCHSLRAAAKPIDEADRHAKKTLKKRVRGMRPLARPREGRTAPQAEVRRGSWSAVRRALPDAGRPPWAASGLQRHARLTAIADSVARVEKRGAGPKSSDA